ncbi:MAG: hypothetical protein AAFX06_19430 [Planctomycetota bacterium]
MATDKSMRLNGLKNALIDGKRDTNISALVAKITIAARTKTRTNDKKERVKQKAITEYSLSTKKLGSIPGKRTAKGFAHA